MYKVRRKRVVGATCFKDTFLLVAIQSLAPEVLEIVERRCFYRMITVNERQTKNK
jgi:hypothetical protein